MNLILFNFESNKNSQALAFALDWVNEIAKNVDKLYVVSLRCGEYKVNDNVEVYCINQDKKSRFNTILSIWKVLKQIHKKDKIDGYFVHMAHYFIPIIYPFAVFYRQKIFLWKAHKSNQPSLKLAVGLVDKIFTVSSQSFPIKTKKLQTIGHGIDTTNRFVFKNTFRDKIKNIVVVGRVTKVKNTDIIVKSFLELKRSDLYLYIIGDVVTKNDALYLNTIKNFIPTDKNNQIKFLGAIFFDNIINIYNNMDLAINLGDGGLDKAIIEPMAMGIPIITSNDSAKELFNHLDKKGVFLLEDKSKLKDVLKEVVEGKYNFDRELLREEIVNNHSLSNLAKKIVSEFYK